MVFMWKGMMIMLVFTVFIFENMRRKGSCLVFKLVFEKKRVIWRLIIVGRLR